jgi:hypothetical protein
MPVLGIIASQMSGHLFAPSGAYDSIATTTVVQVEQHTITFSSIPSYLYPFAIRIFAQSARANAIDYFNMRVNSDTGSNYYAHLLYGNGTSASAYATGTDTKLDFSQWVASSATSVFGTAVIDVLDYANTNKNKTVRCLNGYDANGSGITQLASGLWTNTSAITSLSFYFSNANVAQYSSFALYGIKGA